MCFRLVILVYFPEMCMVSEEEECCYVMKASSDVSSLSSVSEYVAL